MSGAVGTDAAVALVFIMNMLLQNTPPPFHTPPTSFGTFILIYKGMRDYFISNLLFKSRIKRINDFFFCIEID